MTDATPATDLVRPAPVRPFPMLLAIGPGIVVSGSVIGSGELINTPIQATLFGFALLWAVILSCVIKYFLQVEIGRHCLVHNRTTIQAMNLFPGPRVRGTSWIGLAYMACYTVSLASVPGMLSAIAGLLHDVLPLSSDATMSGDAWAVIVFVATLILLWHGVYAELEKLVALLVVGFSFSVIVALLLLQGTSYRVTGPELASGLKFSLGPHNARAAAFAVISLLGALGTTASELFMYPYWILEKGYGRFVGRDDSAGWTERARGWVRVLQLDAGVCTLIATAITAAYFLMGAAVLHREHVVPSGSAVVPQLSAVFTRIYGNWSYLLFMFGAFCTLYSTVVVAAAATGRMWADVLSSLKFLDAEDDRARRRYHRVFQSACLVGALAVVLGLRQPPERLVMFGQYVNGLFGTPLLMFGICWMAFRTDARVRMGRPVAILLVASVVAIAVCLLVSLLVQAGVIRM